MFSVNVQKYSETFDLLIFMCFNAGEAINQFLHNNANELVQEMRPAASQSIGKLFKTILNGAFSSIPLNQWLLD